MKISWNVALNIMNKKMEVGVGVRMGMGMGMVMRDELGVGLTSMATVVPFIIIIDPIVAKAVAAWETIVFCSDVLFQLVRVEGD